MNGQINTGFRPWKPRHPKVTAFLEWLLPSQTPKQRPHIYANNPVLSRPEIQCILDLTRFWTEMEITASEAYIDLVRKYPDRGDAHFHQYRRDCDMIQTEFQRQIRHELKQIERSTGYRLPDEEIALMFEYAENWKSWYIRSQRPSVYGDCELACARARWFFEDYLCTWARSEEEPR
jgi:hypothetical protein